VRLHDVVPLRPGRVGGTGECRPENDAYRDHDDESTEHVFAMMHEHVFDVKPLEWADMSIWQRLKDFARRILMRRTSMHD
jgi:hypothetical protein